MKRTYVYLTGASLVSATGVIAIAAQWGTATAKSGPDAAPAPIVERVSKTPRPIPLVPDNGQSVAADKVGDAAAKSAAAFDPFRAARPDAAGAENPSAQSTVGFRDTSAPANPVRAVRQAVEVQDEAPAAEEVAQTNTEIPTAASVERDPATDRAAGDPFGLKNKAGAEPQRKFAVRQAAAAETPASEAAPAAAAGAKSPWGQYPTAAGSLGTGAGNTAGQAAGSQATTSAINAAGPTGAGAGIDAPQAATNAADTQVPSTASSTANTLRLKKNEPAKIDPFGGPEAAEAARAAQPANSKYPGRPAPFGSDQQDARAMPSTGAGGQDGFVTVPRDNALRPVETGRATVEGTGRPGNKQSEGTQTAQVTIEKKAPPEIQIGKPATFEITVKNVGSVAAQNVEVHDEVPKGTQLVSSTPKANRGPKGELLWVLGQLRAGEESTVKVELMPVGEGEIGSVATLHFDAEATARTISTRPELAVQISAPRQVMIGDDLTLTITVSNPGTGATSGVVLEERVPSGLQHTATGRDDLEFEIGTLKPGQSRQLDLTLKAMQAGKLINSLAVRGDANLRVEEKTDIEVIAPALKVGLTGPSKRFLDRPATYTVSVSNPGTAAAKDVELITYLPKGLKFVKADNSGYYDAQNHRVVWSLAELPPSESGAVKLTAVPIEEGEQKMRIEGKAQQGLSDMEEQAIMVEGVAAIMFEVTDMEDPVEVGGEVTYEIRVINQGSRAASNIRVSAALPSEMKALDGTGPTRAALDDKRVVFDALNRLAPKTDATFRIRAQVLRAGDLRVKAQVVTDEMQAPVTKEESTRVYQDE